MNLLKNIQCYFDLKNSRIQHYFELEKAISDKKQEAQELARDYNLYKKECEQLIKSSDLGENPVSDNKVHIEQRFNKYFVNYISGLDEIKKAVDDLNGKKDKLLQKYPDVKEDIEKAEKDNSQKKKFKKVMREFKEGTLKSSSGEIVTDKDQAIAIAYSESGMDKGEVEKAIVTIVKSYQNGLIKDEEFSIIQKDLEYFIPNIEKAEKIEGGLSDGKTLEEIAKKHKVEIKHIQEQLKIGIKVEKEHTDDESKAKEIATDHLVEDVDYYTKLAKMEKEKSEVLIIEKGEIIAEEPKEIKSQKKYSDAIVRNDKGEILFLHRSKESSFSPDVLCLPGGHIDENETDEDAVKRELIEETSLIATTVTKLAEASNPSISYFEVIVKEPYEVVLVEEEHKNYVWLSMNDSEKWNNAKMIVNLKENLEKIYNPEFKIKKL